MSAADITLTLPGSRAATARSSVHSASLTDEEDSSGTGVHLSPTDGIGSQESSEHEYTEEDSAEDYEEHWTTVTKTDVGSSESASRPSTSNQHRIAETALRHHSRREAPIARRRSARIRRTHPSSPGSVESHEDLAAYGPDLPLRQARPYGHWAQPAGGQGHAYVPPYHGQSYGQYGPPPGAQAGQQLIPHQSPSYPYSPYQSGPPSSVPSYFGQHPGMGGAPAMAAHANPYGNPDMIPHPSVAAYYQYPPQAYQLPHAMPGPSPVYQPYQPVYSPPPQLKAPTPPAPAPVDEKAVKAAEESYNELKKMLLADKADREAREAAAKKAEQEKLAALEAAKAKAEEIAKAAEAAAAAATTEAEKKAADDIAKLKAQAEEAAAKAKGEADDAATKLKEEKDAAVAAAKAAASALEPEEKKKPIKFKDAVGRKFSFPFHLCRTWEGMEDLIHQAFLHVDIIGPHVAEGHYDLIGPNSEIILPGVWETVIEPDWTITMHMWPMPEPAEEPPAIEVPPPLPESGGDKKSGKKPAKKSGGSFWFSGGRPKPKAKPAAKK